MRNLLRKLLSRSTEPPFTITPIVPERLEILPESVTAAKWWGDRLYEIMEALPQLDKVKLAAFEIALCKLISQELAALGPDGEITIYSDYEPGALLGDALHTADIQDTFGIFPWRASTVVGNGSVRAKSAPDEEYQRIPVR